MCLGFSLEECGTLPSNFPIRDEIVCSSSSFAARSLPALRMKLALLCFILAIHSSHAETTTLSTIFENHCAELKLPAGIGSALQEVVELALLQVAFLCRTGVRWSS